MVLPSVTTIRTYPEVVQVPVHSVVHVSVAYSLVLG